MYKFFLILFFSVSLQLSSQVNTQLLANSSWVRVKFSMLDGSRYLSENKASILLWKINENTLCEYSHPIFMEWKSCVDFKLEKHEMKTSPESAYQIEKLTADSLIIIQKVNGIDAPDKIKKMWFVNNKLYINKFLKKSENDSIITAVKDFTPSLKKNIISNILDIYVQKEYTHDFSLVGNILIFPKKQIIKIEIDNKEDFQKNKKSIDLFTSTIEKNYYLWNVSGFENFEKVIIPFKYSSKLKKGEGEINSMGISFFDQNYVDYGQDFIVQIRDKKASQKNFSKAIQAIKDSKFDKAIQFFNAAYEYDNTNTDALYNIVSIAIAQNTTDVACTTLKRLKDLEQREGMKLFKEKCSEKE